MTTCKRFPKEGDVVACFFKLWGKDMKHLSGCWQVVRWERVYEDKVNEFKILHRATKKEREAFLRAL